MKTLSLTLIMSLVTVSSAFALDLGKEGAKVGINIKQIGRAATRATVDRLEAKSNPWYCSTTNQGFGPYTGRGATQTEAAAEALGKCGIHCAFNKEVTCESSQPQQQVVAPAPAPAQPAVIVVQAPPQAPTASCEQIAQSRIEWKEYAERLEKQLQASDAQTKQQACQEVFVNSQFHYQQCLGLVATAAKVKECGRLNSTVHNAITCIATY